MKNKVERMIEDKMNEARRDPLSIQINNIISGMLKEAITIATKNLNYPRGWTMKSGVSRSTATIFAEGTTRSDLLWDLNISGWIADQSDARFIAEISYVMWDRPVKIDEILNMNNIDTNSLADLLTRNMPS